MSIKTKITTWAKNAHAKIGVALVQIGLVVQSTMTWVSMKFHSLRSFRFKTRDFKSRPLAIGLVWSVLITTTLALITSQVFSIPVTWLVYWVIKATTIFDGLIIGFWLIWTLVLSALLLLSPAAQGQKRSPTNDERMLPVPTNFMAILIFGQSRIKWIYLTEGAAMVPWWLFIGVSNAPVSKTKVEIVDDEGRIIGYEERGFFRPQEEFGYVFAGRRTLQERVNVQASDLIPVEVDVEDIISVDNPIAWQGADNPLGTVIGRLRASIRIGVSTLKARDANLVRTLYPSLLAGCELAFLKAARDSEFARRGDLIRSITGAIIFRKSSPFEHITDEDKEAFVEDANTRAYKAFRPGPRTKFKVGMVETLTVYEERHELLDAYGAHGEGTSITDITLPKDIENASLRAEIERAEREAELIEADTAALVAAKYAESIAGPGGREAAELALAERKGTIVLGLGSNPVAQLAGFLHPNKTPGE